MRQVFQGPTAPLSEAAPPGPRGHRLLGSLLDVRRDKLHFIRWAKREYGDLVLFRMGPSRRLYLLSHPELVQHVLHGNARNYVKGLGLEQARVMLGDGILTSEGERWGDQHERMQHLFARSRIDQHAGAVAQATGDLIERWRISAESGQPVDVARDLVRLTLEILGGTLLGADLNGDQRALTGALDEVVRWSMRRMTAVFSLPVAFPTPRNLRCRRALRALDVLADEILERRRTAPPRDDLLAALLEESGSGKPGKTPQALRQQLLSLILAGHETTASALSWCCHLLALHPEIQRRVRSEVMEALPGDTLPTAAHLPLLPYTRTVLEETLRLYPSVWMITRRALADDRIGGYKVPAGSDILISVYTLHRHASFWEQPDEFRPERFAADRAQARLSHAYLPFGTGPRACLGRGFAFLEAVLALSLIVRAYELSPVPGAPVEPEPLLTLRPNRLLQRVARAA